MLMVMVVLLMTTATATFAIHSTSTEIRAAGHYREAVQTEDLAQGAVIATLEYIDAMQPNAMYQQLQRTSVAATARLAPEEVDLGRVRNVFRVEADDFIGAVGVQAPPIETDVGRVPSLGPRTALVPRFNADITDPVACFRDDAGRRSDGANSMQYLCAVVTSRARLAPPVDFQSSGDPRRFHETAVNARAQVEIGPMPRQ